MNSTNYYNTLILIAEDCPAKEGITPPEKQDKKTVANYQFDLLYSNPYKFTSDEVLFSVYVIVKEIPKDELEAEKQKFFSKGQPCFRASPLTKRYGWGIHCDEQGKTAVFGVETEEYRNLSNNENLKKVKAMRSKKA